MRLAICVISYNRPDSLSRCLRSITTADYSGDIVDIVISIDYSGNNSVEIVANDFVWPHGDKRIIAHKKNLGLRKHILSCGEFTK